MHPNSSILCSGEAAASQEWGAGVWAAEPSPAHGDRSTLQDLGLTSGSGWDGEVEKGSGMEIKVGIEVGGFAVTLRDVKAESLVLKILTSPLT